ncbi:hypothetical protein pb186bvf_008522 [Paramecium bursaria]
MNNIADYVLSKVFFKSDDCNHGCSCIERSTGATVRSFKYSYAARVILSLLGLLLRKCKDPKKYLNILYSYHTFRFCGFISSYTFISQFLLCLMKLLMGNKQYQAFLSGLIAGMTSIQFIKREDRKTYALYLIVRSIETRFSQQLKDKNYIFILLFAIMQTINGYVYFFEQDCFGQDQLGTYQKIAFQ